MCQIHTHIQRTFLNKFKRSKNATKLKTWFLYRKHSHCKVAGFYVGKNLNFISRWLFFFLWNSLNKQAHLKFYVDCKLKKRCIFQMPSRHLKGESTFPSESFRHLCKDDFKMYTSLFGIGFSFEHERSVNIIPLFWLVFLWSFVEVYDVQIHYYGKRMMSYEKNASNVIVFVRAILIVKRRVKSLRIGLFAIGSVG